MGLWHRQLGGSDEAFGISETPWAQSRRWKSGIGRKDRGKGQHEAEEKRRAGRKEQSAAQVKTPVRMWQSPHQGALIHMWRAQVLVSLLHSEAGFEVTCLLRNLLDVMESAWECGACSISTPWDHAHSSYPGLGFNTQVQKEGEQCDGRDGGSPGKYICV